MKNDNINFVLILIAYFTIGLLLSANYYANKNIKTMNNSVNRLILTELISEQQLKLLDDRIENIEKRYYRISKNDL